MKRDILEVLGEFFKDDEEAFNRFTEDVDNVNRTVKTEGLIHRAKAAKKYAGPGDEEDEEGDEDTDKDEDGDEEEDEKEEAPVLVLDDAAIAQVKSQIFASPEMAKIIQSYDKINAALEILVQTREADAKAVVELKKSNSILAKRVAELSKGETEKKQTWAEDLPSRRRQAATYQPRKQEAEDEEDGEEDGSEMEEAAKRTLSKLPTYGS